MSALQLNIQLLSVRLKPVLCLHTNTYQTASRDQALMV